MSGSGAEAGGERARRREASEVVAAYHWKELRALLERVRGGFAELDAGVIDEFDLDDLIHRYKRAAGDLWKFCGTSGVQVLSTASAIATHRERMDPIDWWARSARRDRRSSASEDGSAPGG